MRLFALSIFAALQMTAVEAHLCSFFEALNGLSWLVNHEVPAGWTTCTAEPISACDWYGVTCDEQGVVVGLELPFVGAAGELPADLFVQSDLLSLEVLDLHGNELTGELPSSGAICDLVYLEEVRSGAGAKRLTLLYLF